MHPVDTWQVAFLVVMMLATGGACGFSLGVDWLRKQLAKRSDEAAQFEPGDRVTFGDRSYIVVRSVAGERQGDPGSNK